MFTLVLTNCVVLCLVAQSCLTLCDPRLLCPWGLSRQEYWSGLPLPSPLPHYRQVLYCLSHNGPGLLEAFILCSRRWRYKSSLWFRLCPPFAVCFLSKLPVSRMPLSHRTAGAHRSCRQNGGRCGVSTGALRMSLGQVEILMCGNPSLVGRSHADFWSRQQ